MNIYELLITVIMEYHGYKFYMSIMVRLFSSRFGFEKRQDMGLKPEYERGWKMGRSFAAEKA